MKHFWDAPIIILGGLEGLLVSLFIRGSCSKTVSHRSCSQIIFSFRIGFIFSPYFRQNSFYFFGRNFLERRLFGRNLLRKLISRRNFLCKRLLKEKTSCARVFFRKNFLSNGLFSGKMFRRNVLQNSVHIYLVFPLVFFPEI